MSAVDDWSGSIMLPFLYRALTATPRQHTFTSVATSGERGVKTYLASLTPAQRHAIKAVIALDALGLGPMRFHIHLNNELPSPSENYLKIQLFEATDNEGLKAPESTIPGSWFRIDDTKAFRNNGIPAILLHSVDGAGRNVPGSPDDTSDVIDGNAYFVTYMTLCYYLVGLDQIIAWSAQPPPPSTISRGLR